MTYGSNTGDAINRIKYGDNPPSNAARKRKYLKRKRLQPPRVQPSNGRIEDINNARPKKEFPRPPVQSPVKKEFPFERPTRSAPSPSPTRQRRDYPTPAANNQYSGPIGNVANRSRDITPPSTDEATTSSQIRRLAMKKRLMGK